MKKLLTIIIGLLMVMLVLAAQPPVPAPVKIIVSVNGEAIDYADAKVTNQRTGEVLTKEEVGSLHITNGIGLVDLSEFEQGYIAANAIYAGDEIEIVACNVDADCTKTFNLDETPITIRFNVISGDAYICWDGSVVTNANDCPVQEEPEPEPAADSEPKVSSVDADTAKVEAFIGQEIDIKVEDNKLSTLLDEEIEFNDDEYDVREEILFKGITKTSLDDEDFGLDVYLIVEEEAIEYRYVFDDAIDLSEIEEDEELEITFLGMDLRIIDASANSITVRTGEEYFLEEGEEIVIDGKKLTVVTVGENSVLVNVDGSESIINDDNAETIGELSVYVTEILYKNYEGSFVELLVGQDTDEEISNGDDFFEDESWRWNINLPGYIGISNNEEFKYLDEDYMPLKEGEMVRFPNDFAAIEFYEVTESDRIEMKMKVKEAYLKVEGDAEDSFAGDYDLLYINSNGIYDEDYELIAADKVRIGDSDTYIELGSIKIGKLEIKLDMSDILYDGVSFSSKDSKYLDYFGLIFEDPEQAVDDKSGFEVSVPEERPEIVVKISSEVEAEEEEEVTEPIEPTEPVEPTPEPVIPVEPVKPIEPVVKPTEPVVEPIVEPVEPVEPGDNTLRTVLITLIASIIGLFTWGKGFAGLIKYYLRKADEARKAGDKALAEKLEARASKMAKTVVTNFLAGKYKK